jgi:hypothetical protein
MGWRNNFRLKYLRYDRWFQTKNYVVCLGRLSMYSYYPWGIWVAKKRPLWRVVELHDKFSLTALHQRLCRPGEFLPEDFICTGRYDRPDFAWEWHWLLTNPWYARHRLS